LRRRRQTGGMHRKAEGDGVVYTVWMYGQKIGETRFEALCAGRRRAGVFHPTEFGIAMLPGITDMFPALVAFRDMCERAGVDVDDDRPETGRDAFEAFKGTPEGKRVVAAARRIAEIEVREETGESIQWESLAISNLEELVALAAQRTPSRPEPPQRPNGDPVRFLISLTVATEGGDQIPVN
jgi:hypothetical protein